jgi:hypothetical protein
MSAPFSSTRDSTTFDNSGCSSFALHEWQNESCDTGLIQDWWLWHEKPQNQWLAGSGLDRAQAGEFAGLQ